jgi:hypothetical protein
MLHQVFQSSVNTIPHTNYFTVYNKDRASRQTHKQGNNKNNEGKQHRNKTQMETCRVLPREKKAEKAAKQNPSSI